MFGIPQDVLLPLACAAGGVFGSLLQAMIATIQLDGPPNKIGILKEAPPELVKARGAWLFMRSFIGGVSGFVFGLYFIGTLNDAAGTFARIWALSFAVGYAAPKLWITQEKTLLKELNIEEPESEKSPPTAKSDG